MQLVRQLEFGFPNTDILSVRPPGVSPGESVGNMAALATVDKAVLQSKARDFLRSLGATRLARLIRVEWNERLKTCAGRADYRSKLILLNPQLVHYPSEIDRTLRHELGHILAQFRAGRRRILPHGIEWRKACHDLGIADEKRCHNLPFPVKQRARSYLYRCPNCQRDFPRVRRVKRAVACLACCRAHNGGEFDARFRLRPVESTLL